jgi:hypothetical protein
VSRNQKAPLLAFVLVALVCGLIVLDSVRTEASERRHPRSEARANSALVSSAPEPTPSATDAPAAAPSGTPVPDPRRVAPSGVGSIAGSGLPAPRPGDGSGAAAAPADPGSPAPGAPAAGEAPGPTSGAAPAASGDGPAGADQGPAGSEPARARPQGALADLLGIDDPADGITGRDPEALPERDPPRPEVAPGDRAPDVGSASEAAAPAELVPPAAEPAVSGGP